MSRVETENGPISREVSTGCLWLKGLMIHANCTQMLSVFLRV